MQTKPFPRNRRYYSGNGDGCEFSGECSSSFNLNLNALHSDSHSSSRRGRSVELLKDRFSSELQPDSPESSSKMAQVFSPIISPMRHAVSLSLLDDEEFMQIKSPKTVMQPITPTSIGQIFRGFCGRTSAHGIPHIGASLSVIGKMFWTIVFLICLTAFIVQTHWTFSRFLQRDKIIEMELKFEPAPFPAVSVCNLNPYKHSDAQTKPALKKQLNIYLDAKKQKAGGTSGSRGSPPPGTRGDGFGVRKKRALDIIPLLVHCDCRGGSHVNCIPDRQMYKNASDVCVCYDKGGSEGDILWPCYRRSIWVKAECTCDEFASACKPLHPRRIWPSKGFEPAQSTYQNTTVYSCLCQNASYGCLRTTSDELPWWDPRAYPTIVPPIPTTTRDPRDYERAGYLEGDNEMSLTVKANENVMFAAAGLPTNERINISYTKYDLIQECSFNAESCDIELDFRLHLDPIFGNCFIFNFNHSENARKFNSRAGPKYGLRVLVNVNQSDYLPTTEAAGVRVNVHDQLVETFPDTFGYSAPTGFVSSFGIKAAVLQRLDDPYGSCIRDGERSEYMYLGRYSTETCFRTCLQSMIHQMCDCTDPRLPAMPNIKHCHVSGKQRECVENVTRNIDPNAIQTKCNCLRPCNESVFQVTYSAATWPAKRFEKGCDFIKDDPNNWNSTCQEYYRENTAFIEVFYEQLSYEIKKEKEAYGMESLMADLGGNIGLWIGFSAITCVEWLLLFIEILLYFCDSDRRRRSKRRRQFKKKSEASAHRNSVVPPVIINEHSELEDTYVRTTNF